MHRTACMLSVPAICIYAIRFEVLTKSIEDMVLNCSLMPALCHNCGLNNTSL
jgi:hypothetical protein